MTRTYKAVDLGPEPEPGEFLFSLVPIQDETIGKNHVGRARRAGVEWEYISLLAVAERDGWLCGICGGVVPQGWGENNRKPMPSLDHVIPIYHGGPHLYGNVQLAHFFCNLSKGSGKREPHRPQALSLASFTEAARGVFARAAAGVAA